MNGETLVCVSVFSGYVGRVCDGFFGELGGEASRFKADYFLQIFWKKMKMMHFYMLVLRTS